MDRLLVLGWHNVLPTPAFPGDGRGAAGLEAQLRWLRRVARVLPLHDALDALTTGRRVGARAVAITFDDGYRDNLDVAAPVLARLDLPATFFLVPDVLDGKVVPWWEQLAAAVASTVRPSIAWGDARFELATPLARRDAIRGLSAALKRENEETRRARVDTLVAELEGSTEVPAFLDWNGARDLCARGFDIGAHSMSHPILSREDPATQHAELEGSKAALERELGRVVDMVAYPNGGPDDYGADTIAAARAAGFRYGLTTRDGWNDATVAHLEVRRVVVEPSGGAVALAKAWKRAVTARRVERNRLRA